MLVNDGEKHKKIKAYFSDQGLCGSDGLDGENIKKSTLNGMMSSDEIRALAFVESSWTQYTCARLPRHNPVSHAVGIMQLIPPKKGYTEQELQWDEKRNLQCGTDFHTTNKNSAAKKMQNAPSGDPPGGIDRQDAELLEAFACYMLPSVGYWNFNGKPRAWTRRRGSQSDCADKVLKAMQDHAWNALPECPCHCGGE